MGKSSLVPSALHSNTDWFSCALLENKMLSKKIKDLRKLLGKVAKLDDDLSQKRFAKGLGVHERTVQDWEYDKKMPINGTILTLEHLATCKKFQKKFLTIALKN